MADYPDAYEYPAYNDEEFVGPTGFSFVLVNLQLFLILPIIMTLSLILFIKIVGNAKIRGEPWRWLIAHQSFLMIILCIIQFNEDATGVYNFPSLMTTVLCPVFSILRIVIWHMTLVSSALLIAERFAALRQGKENEGGMSKKAVILSLVIFWILITLLHTVSLPIKAALTGYSGLEFLEYFNHQRCFLTNYEVYVPVKMLLYVWNLVTYFIGIIGVAVYKNRKSTTDSMKQSIVAPTLAVSIFGLIFNVLPVIVSSLIIYQNMLYALTFIFEIAFPIIWLVTWTRTGDISWAKKEEEQKRLLDEQEMAVVK